MFWEVIEAFRKAVELIVSFDSTVIEITLRSIFLSGTATLLSALWSLPLGIMIGMKEFLGKSLVKSVFNALLGVPTVALGLILYLILSKHGPLGFLSWLYSPLAIMLGQAILISPILISFVASAVEAVDPQVIDLAKTLGASETEASVAVLRESREPVFLAIVAGFNRAIAELGIALMLGGNIVGWTRVLTTTIALETGRGNLALAIALSTILLLIVFSVSILINLIERRRR
ncbi:MAG: ABC transporter permease [Candidatus Bathyarchaeota archaeon]|nr:MAG: ABC transporter permease [Candidatus Bathyarchaeota archaeon]